MEEMQIYYLRTPASTYYFFLVHQGQVQTLGSIGYFGSVRKEGAMNAAVMAALAARISSKNPPPVQKVPLKEDVLEKWTSLPSRDEEAALALAEAALEAAHKAGNLEAAETSLREALNSPQPGR